MDTDGSPPGAGAAPWRSRLWRKYAVVMVALCMAAIAGFGGVEMAVTFADAQAQAARLQTAQAGEAAAALRAALVNIDRHVAAVNELPWQTGWPSLQTRREEFARLLRLVPAVDHIAYRDGGGHERVRVSRRDLDLQPGVTTARAAPAQSTQAAAPAAAPTAASADAVVGSQARHGRVVYSGDLEPVLELALADPPGELGGLTTVRVGLRALARELRPALTRPDAEVYAVDEAGVVALHRDPLTMLSRVQARLGLAAASGEAGAALDVPDAAASAPVATGFAARSAIGLQGGEVLMSAVPIAELGWLMVVEQPRSAAMAPVWATVRRTAVFLTLGVALAMGAALALAGRLTRPIRQLHGAVERLRAGRLDTAIEIRSGDELEDLARQFNRMADSLRASVTDLEERIAARTLDLQRANRHKSEFLANMSHELRTPLNAVLGFADVLREGMVGPINEQQRECVADIHASGAHLLALINDVLDLSKIEAGQLALEWADFDVAESVAGAAALVRQRCSLKGLALSVELTPEATHWHGDARRFKQIVLNLLGNAVKFTPPGGAVTLRGGVHAEQGLWIEVQDNGIGIAEADQELVFQEFAQVGNDKAGRAEGTGLGLSLVRRLVEQHGGRITLHSRLGEGATFRFNIPYPTPRSAA